MTYKTLGILAVSMLFLVTMVSGVPNTGVPTLISSNNVTIPLTGVTGDDCWVLYGMNSGAGYVWSSSNYTAVGGSKDVLIWGAPLTGGTQYYAVGCDVTGCDPNEVTFSTLAITPLPTTTFGAGYVNLSRSHFNILYVPAVVESVYSLPDYRFPRTLLYGLLLGLIFVGLWLRTRSIRLVSSLSLMLGMMLFSNASGLYLGIPLQEQLLGSVLLAAGFAGWMLSLWVKK